MAWNGCQHRGRVARGRAIETPAQTWILVVSRQQCSVDSVGLARWRMGVDCAASRARHVEHSRLAQKRAAIGGIRDNSSTRVASDFPTEKLLCQREPMKKVVIHSDGGCHGNPGPGGWAAVLTHGKHSRVIRGGSPATTNNRMELQAAIEALNALKEPCEVAFYTDSQYVKKGVESWVHGWKKNGWKTSTREPVKNEDLWRALDAAQSRHRVHWNWLKGHAGHKGNEQCDAVANEEIAKIKNTFTPAELKAALARFFASQSAVHRQPDLF